MLQLKCSLTGKTFILQLVYQYKYKPQFVLSGILLKRANHVS